MSVGPTVLMVRNGTGAPARLASSMKISCSIIERFWPPYSVGPADAEPAVLAHLADEALVEVAAAVLAVAGGHLLLDLGRHQLGEVGAQLLAERLLLLRERDLHATPSPAEREPVLPLSGRRRSADTRTALAEAALVARRRVLADPLAVLDPDDDEAALGRARLRVERRADAAAVVRR